MNEEETNDNFFKIACNTGCFIGGFGSFIFFPVLIIILFTSILIYFFSKIGATKQRAFWLMLGSATALGLFGLIAFRGFLNL